MKYCTKCGNELIDEAIVCTKCGCMVGAPVSGTSTTATPAPAAVEEHPCEKKERFRVAVAVLNFVSDIVALFCGVLMAIGVSLVYIDSSAVVKNYSSYSGRFNVSVYSSAEFYEGWYVFSWLLSFIVVGLGITGFVLAMVGKQGAKNILGSIKRALIGLAIGIVALFFLGF